MSKFKREFDVDRAKEAVGAPENAWFKDLIRHWRPAGDAQVTPNPPPGAPLDHLRLAIRDGYLNFYSAGQSIAKVGFVKGKLQAEIHNKYVYGPEKGRGQEYVKIISGRFRGQDGADVEYRSELLHHWILNARAYEEKNKEKRFVEELVAWQPGVIDLEAASPSDGEATEERSGEPKQTKKSAPRMDLVTIEPCGDHYSLVFREVKLVSNPETKCENAAKPPRVIAQLTKYETWLASNRKLVREAYHDCCATLVKLHGIAKAVNPAISPLGSAIIAVGQDFAPLCVDGTPQLVIDATMGEGVFVEHGHLKKLQNYGICVRMVRKPADLVMSAYA